MYWPWSVACKLKSQSILIREIAANLLTPQRSFQLVMRAIGREVPRIYTERQLSVGLDCALNFYQQLFAEEKGKSNRYAGHVGPSIRNMCVSAKVLSVMRLAKEALPPNKMCGGWSSEHWRSLNQGSCHKIPLVVHDRW
ncbi:hypothetical protein BS78_04G132500 [Paspalum vaginatum]|nr:hypothetical protein BS78_04G132500 [Paspalum vaginatum]